jgi:hypothetical protein
VLQNNGEIKVKCANRQSARRNIWQRSRVMQDLLQHIDLDYYRTARLLIARAEVAQLRGRSPPSARVEQRGKMPSEAARAVDDLDQLLMRFQLDSPKVKGSR